MTVSEMKRRNPCSNQPEDLCGNCKYLVFLDVEDIYTDRDDYAFGEITESYKGLLGSCKNDN